MAEHGFFCHHFLSVPGVRAPPLISLRFLWVAVGGWRVFLFVLSLPPHAHTAPHSVPPRAGHRQHVSSADKGGPSPVTQEPLPAAEDVPSQAVVLSLAVH